MLKSFTKSQLKFIRDKNNNKLADKIRKILKKHKLETTELTDIIEKHFENKGDIESRIVTNFDNDNLESILRKASNKKKSNKIKRSGRRSNK